MHNLLGSAERFYKRLAGNSSQNASSTRNHPVKNVNKTIDSRLPEEQISGTDKILSMNWADQANYSANTRSLSNLAIYEDTASSATEPYTLQQNKNESYSTSARAHPPGELTAVSSSDGDDDEEAEVELDEEMTEIYDNIDETSNNNNNGLNAEGFEPLEVKRRTRKFRKSIQRAHANRAADFEDRLFFCTTVSSSGAQSRCPSSEQLHLNVDISSDEEYDNSENECSDTHQKYELSASENTRNEFEDVENQFTAEEETGEASERRPKVFKKEIEQSNVQKNVVPFNPQKGVYWANDSPETLVELLPKIREPTNPQKTQFIRAVCQRPSCRCLLRGHDILMLYPIFDAVICESTWEKIIENHANSKIGNNFLSKLYSHSASPTSETLAKLIMFRQCRGWYEVMNEDHETVPHWSTLEELRRARPKTFLVRRELKCLVTPPHLWLPPDNESNACSVNRDKIINETPPSISISSSTLTEALNANSITASLPCVIKPGTLLTYIDYLPSCTVKRGKKLKQIPLLLAAEKSRSSKQTRSLVRNRKLYYLGIEEPSSQAFFPSKLALSSIAGPENISGVHIFSSLLRKFRLPFSVSPVAVPEKRLSNSGSTLSVESEFVNYATAQSTKPVNIFPSVPGLTLTERNYLRLRQLYRGDILIIAPIDAPDRFFLITPTLLQDHLFQVGSTEDPVYHRLATGHFNRAMNFLSTAHPRDSLSYLLRYMKNITNESRTSHSSKASGIGKTVSSSLQPNELSSAAAWTIYNETGMDPRVGPECNLTPDQVDCLQEEVDDLYFFTRNGYFPAKTRQRQVNSRKSEQQEPLTQAQPLPGPKYQAKQVPRQIVSAEQLLAASLNISTYK